MKKSENSNNKKTSRGVHMQKAVRRLSNMGDLMLLMEFQNDSPIPLTHTEASLRVANSILYN